MLTEYECYLAITQGMALVAIPLLVGVVGYFVIKRAKGKKMY